MEKDKCPIENYYDQLDKMLVEVEESISVNDKRIEELFRQIQLERWAIGDI